MIPGGGYSLDTSVFVNSWRRHYPPDAFPTVLERLSGLVSGGGGFASEEVREDLERQDDEVLAWVRERDAMFVSTDEAIQRSVSAMLAATLG